MYFCIAQYVCRRDPYINSTIHFHFIPLLDKIEEQGSLSQRCHSATVSESLLGKEGNSDVFVRAGQSWTCVKAG